MRAGDSAPEIDEPPRFSETGSTEAGTSPDFIELAWVEPGYPIPIPNRFAWSRFAARMVDTWTFALPTALLLGATGVPNESLSGATILAVLFLYPFYEGFLIHRFTSTPGKALMNVQMIKRRDLSLADSNGRAISAHFGGFFGAIPILAQAAAYMAYRQFLATGRTRWDDEAPIYANPLGAGPLRWLAFFSLGAFILFLSVLGDKASEY